MTMITPGLANCVVVGSLLVFAGVYIWFSRREGSYVNFLTPFFLIQVPAYFLLQLAYIDLFDPEYSAYAYVYVYATLAANNLAFAWGYSRWRSPAIVKRATWSNRRFFALSFVCLALAAAAFAQVLFEFQEFLFDPREIYRLTRTGFGHETFVSSMLAYLSIIFILFAKRSWGWKVLIILAASGLLLLQGSKGRIVDVVFLILLFQVYVSGKKMALLPALLRFSGIALIITLLFAMTMSMDGGAAEAVESISQYSDYTRNAMLVIDSRFPLQYGRITMEANLYGLIPRVLMPDKPKNFGVFHLAEEFYPDWFEADTGSPDFGIGVQYADFGYLAVVYLALFAMLQGYLAHMFIDRLKVNRNPGDFLVMLFLAGISILPIGGAGWLFPEILVLAWIVRRLSRTVTVREALGLGPIEGGVQA